MHELHDRCSRARDGAKMILGLLAPARTTLFGVLVAGCAAVCPAWAQSDEAAPTGAPAASPAQSNAVQLPARKASPHRTEKLTGKGKNYYIARWGVDKLRVSYTSSGNLIRFSYRVSDPQLATALVRQGRHAVLARATKPRRAPGAGDGQGRPAAPGERAAGRAGSTGWCSPTRAIWSGPATAST